MIAVERAVAATCDEVWSFLGDLDGWAAHLSTVDEVARTSTPGPVGVGARFRLKQRGLVAAEYVVTDWRPGQAFTWEASSRGLRAVATHRLSGDPAGCLLELSIEWSGLAAPLVRLLLSRKAQNYVVREAAEFAALAEQARGSSGKGR